MPLLFFGSQIGQRMPIRHDFAGQPSDHVDAAFPLLAEGVWSASVAIQAALCDVYSAIVTALYRRERTGKGAYVTTSMRQKSNSTPASSETLVRNIRRATRKHHAAEEKIRIVLDGLRGANLLPSLVARTL